MKKQFRLDRSEGIAFGVCAGIANYTGWDATLVRIGLVVLTLMGGFPWTLIAYGAVAWLVKPADGGSAFPSRNSERRAASGMGSDERRTGDLDRTFGGENEALAREIEQLR